MRWVLIFPLFIASAVSAAATTQPANRPAAIAVLPFRVLAEGNRHDWIGPALQESLVADLKSEGGMRVMTCKDPQAAGKLQYAYLISGSAQVSGETIRITGEVLGNGKTIGSLKATGGYRDLFSLQEILSRQAARLIPGMKPDRTISPELARAVQKASRPSGPLTSRPQRPTLQQTLDQVSPLSGDYRSGRQHYSYGIPTMPYVYNSYGMYSPYYPIIFLPWRLEIRAEREAAGD